MTVPGVQPSVPRSDGASCVGVVFSAVMAANLCRERVSLQRRGELCRVRVSPDSAQPGSLRTTVRPGFGRIRKRQSGQPRRLPAFGTRSGNRTRTTIAGHRILSPACLPIPPSEPHTPFLRKATAKVRNILRFYKPLRLLPPQKKRGRRPQRPCVSRSSVSRWRPGWLRRHRARTTGFRGRAGTT